MRLLTKCPECGTAIELTLADADRRKRCPRCRGLFHVPDTDALHNARYMEIRRAAHAPFLSHLTQLSALIADFLLQS